MKTIQINKSSDFKKLTKDLEKKYASKPVRNKIVRVIASSYKKELENEVAKFSDTRALKRSWRLKVRGKIAYIYSNLPYANIQDKGGRIRITKKMRKQMWALYYKTKNVMYKAIAITKKNYIRIKGKHYTDKVSFNKVFRSSKRRLNKAFKTK